MNYEELYAKLQLQEKAVKDTLTTLQKLYKAISRETESGDLKSLVRDLDVMETAVSSASVSLKEVQDTVSAFDAGAYFGNGEFAEQMLSCCQENGVDVKGEFPIYEMFPYRVRVDAENQDIYLDRKRIQCMRPQSFVEMVKKGQEKLNRAAFNPLTFASELGEAYELALVTLGKQPGTDLYLKRLYKFLTPMSRFRKDYDMQSYAFDLARLYNSGAWETKSGKRCQFGPSRELNKCIRILNKDGKEEYFATIRFYDPGEQ